MFCYQEWKNSFFVPIIIVFDSYGLWQLLHQLISNRIATETCLICYTFVYIDEPRNFCPLSLPNTDWFIASFTSALRVKYAITSKIIICPILPLPYLCRYIILWHKNVRIINNGLKTMLCYWQDVIGLYRRTTKYLSIYICIFIYLFNLSTSTMLRNEGVPNKITT